MQAVLSEVLGGRPLDRHLDSDEAAVLGASLFAANLSTSFRLKKFGITDGAMYGVAIKVRARSRNMLCCRLHACMDACDSWMLYGTAVHARSAV